MMKPKAFISYSWTNHAHQQFVLSCAERLIADGVQVVMDVYDLKEGYDKNQFMEKMVSDKTVTHVLLFSDKVYSEKANLRKAGVGTESQIISREIYASVEQSKFIPLVCEFDSNGEAFLPIFLSSRIWIDFSSQEAVNKNWEKLIRLLYGKPLVVKPELGTAPIYIKEDLSKPSNPARAKFETLKQAINEEKRGIRRYRVDFLEACYSYIDGYRVKTVPQSDVDWGTKILSDSDSLVVIRDLLVDWILFEAQTIPASDFGESVIEMLERLRELRSRPDEINSWTDVWFEPIRLFTYEVFLYTVAALVRAKGFELLNEVYTTHYPTPKTERYAGSEFEKFGCFYAYSDTLNPVLAPPGQRLHSAAAELIKRHASRNDLPFRDVIQADLLSLLMAFIQEDVRWYPQTLYYSSFARNLPFFERATQHKHFLNLGKITGISDANKLRTAVKAGHERLETNRWNTFYFDRTFWEAMNMEKLDSLK